MKTDYDLYEKQTTKNENEKPKLKHKGWAIFGVVLFGIGLCMFISLFILTFCTMGSTDFESGRRLITVIAVLGFGGMVCMIFGGILAAPLFTKVSAKYNKYVATYAKDDLSALMETNAEIASKGLTKSVRAIKEGLKDNKEDLEELSELGGEIQSKGARKVASGVKEGFDDASKTKFCSNCGGKIKPNAKFCEHCGSKQN